MTEQSPSLTRYVTTIDPSLATSLASDLEKQGFELSHPAYTFFSAKKKNVTCVLYHSGKLVVQGKGTSEFVEFFLEPEVLKTFDANYQERKLDKTPRIGIDESGKGDFFGPLCIAGVYASENDIEKLFKLGVCDSKKLSDKAIFSLAPQILSSCQHHIVKINPHRYNELYKQFNNLNHLLAWGHATTIEHLIEQTQCRRVIIDQFAHEHVVITALKRKKITLDLFQRHRAEEDLIVAAASILARYAFLQGLKKLGDEYKTTLPKGASAQTIATGKALVQKYGREVLESVAKMHFKTLDAILS
jgi:ribonuclease HIII